MDKTYACTRCGETKSRNQLMVKKAVFLTMGEGGRTIRSRVTDWLCGRCAADDSDWNREFSRGRPPIGPIIQGPFASHVPESEATHLG